ncbi:protein FAM8A1-like isoform X2 [Liolophura sinensis]|uniref:protein FAM8A1-like isoform X2 n=1 Tax=Liolophura sinensis TaxID=3198878 RepID=UPI0031582B64
MASNDKAEMKTGDQQQQQQRTSERFDISSASNMANMKSAEQRRYNSVQEYSRTLQHWLWNYHCMASASSFYSMMPLYMAGALPPGVVSPQSTVNGPTQGTRHGTEYTLPSVWKRLAAEVIDFFILFYIKLIVSIGIMRQMGILETDHVELEAFYQSMILSPDDVDLDKVFALTSEIIALEVVNRICITIVETLCLRRGIGVVGGSTPGKRILGLCVVSCQDVVDLGNGKVRVRPAENIGLKRALVRSVIKNFTLAFFFPACLTIFFFHHNRAAYDVIAGTIVVQNVENQEHR